MSFAGESSRHHQELVQQDDAAMDTDDNPSPEALNNYSRQVVQHATLQPTQHTHAARMTLNTNTTAVSARQQQQQQRQQEHHLAMPDSNATTTEDYNTIIGHIRHEAEGMSHRSKLNSTFVHLNYFLKNYTEGAMKEKTASTLVYKDIKHNYLCAS
jgi:hypothetical protein